jgi:HD-GYP domain-containing protein (c-di-GMP phosphodiesterase class II)
VADAFDAITSDRVYRRGKSYQEAADELDEWSGKQFDPKVVEAFHRVPQQDWDELRNRSLMPKAEDHKVRRVVQSLESHLEALVT